MKQRIMGVYDIDPFYADRFADFVNQKEKVPFTVMAFTTLERLKEYVKLHAVEVLLIHSGVLAEELEKLPIEQIITLADGEVMQLQAQYPSIYKYQSSDSIIREVMACYCEKTETADFAVLGAEAKVNIIGIYSPVNRCLKTSFALTMGQLLAKDTKVLYLNLEEYSGLEKLTGARYQSDLSDVIYHYRQGNYSWFRLSSAVYSWGNLDYIPPARCSEDLCQIESEDMAKLLQKIAAESTYDTIILDLGQFGKKAVEVLDICKLVYMPVKDDCISVAKVEEFEEYLMISGMEALKNRIQKLKLPYHNSFGRKESYMEQLLWGELGDYTRGILKGKVLWEH